MQEGEKKWDKEVVEEVIEGKVRERKEVEEEGKDEYRKRVKPLKEDEIK